tara:strand:- start:2725 stop:3288 length:564 start_codon:yes stop_codon:yes gene_type:complete
MYGLVHTVFREFLERENDKDIWKKVMKEAGVKEQDFITMESYDDDITYRLFGSASQVLERNLDDLLHNFGIFWVIGPAQTGWYGELLHAAGSTLPELISNLNQLHDTVRSSLPDLKPPRFKCLDVTDSSLRVRYYSHRPGLTPFVVGLIYGLGQYFKLSLSVTTEKTREEGAQYDEFYVTYEKIKDG